MIESHRVRLLCVDPLIELVVCAGVLAKFICQRVVSLLLFVYNLEDIAKLLDFFFAMMEVDVALFFLKQPCVLAKSTLTSSQ